DAVARDYHPGAGERAGYIFFRDSVRRRDAMLVAVAREALCGQTFRATRDLQVLEADVEALLPARRKAFRVQIRGPVGVGIRVCGDVQPCGARGVEQRER